MSSKDNPRLLVWPKTIQGAGRQRPRQLAETGWVLGWNEDGRSMVCAGILDKSKTLQEYQERLRQLKGSICPCLSGSLEIIASWSTTKKPNSSKPDGGLPMITNERNYPWLSQRPTADDKKSYQLLYYSIYPENKLAHLKTEFGGQDQSSTSSFSLLLHRINHAPELMELMQSDGTIPKLRRQPPPTSKPNKVSSSSAKEALKDTSSVLNRMKRSIFDQSLVLQHIYQMTNNKKSILNVIPAFRCGKELRQAFFASHPPPPTTICSHCNEPSILPSRSKLAKAHVDHCNQFASSCLDMLLGGLVGLLLYLLLQLYLWHNSSSSTTTDDLLYHLRLKRFCIELLLDRVAWLEDFPAGFKLNVKLTHNLGFEIRNLLHLHQQVLNATLWHPQFHQDWLLPFLAGIGFCFGWTGLLAVVMDLTRLELVHTVVLASWFRNLYRAELYLLSSLWRLFRGKKRNVLRQRTDSMQYDSMQLLVGTVAFCICIFLWTTVWVYYTFFMVWNIGNHLLIVTPLWVLYVTSRSIPWASLWFRTISSRGTGRSNWFAHSVHSQLLLQEENLVVSRLVARNQSHWTILVQRFGVHTKPLFQWLLSFVLEALIPRSSTAAPCSLPLATLLEAFDSA